jgi:glycosyltransferase involved in cell wall biosynthesis
MAATAQLVQPLAPAARRKPLVLCHCTLAHRELKSRTYHRELLPLARLGFDVRFVTPMKRRDPVGAVRMIPFSVPSGALRRLFVWPRLLKTLLRQNAQLYHFQDPQLLPLALALKVLFRKRIVYDAYEDFPSIALAKKSIPALLRPIVAAAISLSERLAAHLADAITTADPITLRRFASIGKSKKLVFYNFPNLDFFPVPRLRPAQFDLIYRGGISARTGILVLIDALRLLSARAVRPRLLLLGYFDSPQDEQRFRNLIRTLRLEPQVEIRGRIDHARMASALSEARIGVSPLLGVPKFQKNIPVKIFEYWACGLPVIATDLDPMRPFFRNSGAGLLVQPGNATELAEAIEWLLDHPDSSSRMGKRGRELADTRFNHTSEVHKLRRLFESVARSHPTGDPQP